MEILFYPHPTLRHRSKPLRRIDAELGKIVANMFDLMYQARGIGLAANQVGLPLQLFVLNTSGNRGEGEELVFINPHLSKPKGTDIGDEGCLSIPGLTGPVCRPAKILVNAFDLSGNEIEITASGLLARAIQHEFDHLNGVLFIDRLSEFEQRQIEPELEEFQLEFLAKQRTGKIPSNVDIRRHLGEWENKYC